jgi:hypothetical protein
MKWDLSEFLPCAQSKIVHSVVKEVQNGQRSSVHAAPRTFGEFAGSRRRNLRRRFEPTDKLFIGAFTNCTVLCEMEQELSPRRYLPPSHKHHT